MGYFTEGAILARMAEVAVRRRLPEDTASSLLDEMLIDLDLPGAEFGGDEDLPGHPLGDLIVEAFGGGQAFPSLKSVNIWNIHRGEDHIVVDDDTLEQERDRYFALLRQFRARYGL